MTLEIELKFAMSDNGALTLAAFLENYPIVDRAHYLLKNYYYDTANYILRKNSCSLRVREILQSNTAPHYEMTLKRSNYSVGGLHRREEFIVPLPNNQLNIAAFSKEVWPENTVSSLQKETVFPLFVTHFNRNTLLIRYGISTIEVACDKGYIKKADRQRVIDEIELELISGRIDDLLNFAMELSGLGLRLLSQSKASRGYRLVRQNKMASPEYNLDTSDYGQPESLKRILKFWQSSEEYALHYENGELPYILLKKMIKDLAFWFSCCVGSSYVCEAKRMLVIITALLNQKPGLAEWLYEPKVTRFKLLLQKILNKD